MNSTYNLFVFLLMATAIGALILDFYVTISKRMTIVKKRSTHLKTWALLSIPLSALLASVLIAKGYSTLGSLLWGLGLISNLTLNVIAVAYTRHYQKKFHYDGLIFIMDVGIALSKYMNDKLNETRETADSQYEIDCEVSCAMQTANYLRKIQSLANGYYKATENFEIENSEIYKKQISIEEQKIRLLGVDYGENGEIKNIERMLEII